MTFLGESELTTTAVHHHELQQLRQPESSAERSKQCGRRTGNALKSTNTHWVHTLIHTHTHVIAYLLADFVSINIFITQREVKEGKKELEARSHIFLCLCACRHVARAHIHTCQWAFELSYSDWHEKKMSLQIELEKSSEAWSEGRGRKGNRMKGNDK